jgi:hypothetical protein
MATLRVLVERRKRKVSTKPTWFPCRSTLALLPPAAQCSDMVCAANNLVRVVVLKQGQVTQFETFHHQMVEWCACISLSWRVSSPEIAPVVIRLVFSLPSCFKSSQIVFGHRLLKILLVERLLKGEKKIR